MSFVLLFTGHLMDAVDRPSQRFTPSQIDHAKNLIGLAIDKLIHIQPIAKAISSLGAGGDIIFAAEIIKRNIPLHVFLPFEEKKFIEESVNYLKNNQETEDTWRAEFERIISKAASVTILEHNPDDNPFAHCNDGMLQFALQSTGTAKSCSAIALVRPGEERVIGGAVDFVEKIKEKGIPVQVIWPYEKSISENDLHKLEKFIPAFHQLDQDSIYYQSKWAFRLKLSLVILGGIAFFDSFVTVPDHFLFGHGKLLRIVALISSVLGAFITLQLQLSDKTSLSQWTRSRAKAEQIRSEIWFYLFNLWTENNRYSIYTEGEFEAYLKRIIINGSTHVVDVNPLIQLKENILTQPLPLRIEFYCNYRIKDQLDYFLRKQKHFQQRLKRYKNIIFLLLSFSISWGVLKMLGEFYPAFVPFAEYSPLGMVISFIALVSSYSEANNSKEMEYKYSQMTEGMRDLLEQKSKILGRAEFDEWVKACEVFLRTQNNEWNLKRV